MPASVHIGWVFFHTSNLYKEESQYSLLQTRSHSNGSRDIPVAKIRQPSAACSGQAAPPPPPVPHARLHRGCPWRSTAWHRLPRISPNSASSPAGSSHPGLGFCAIPGYTSIKTFTLGDHFLLASIVPASPAAHNFSQSYFLAHRCVETPGSIHPCPLALVCPGTAKHGMAREVSWVKAGKSSRSSSA